MEHIFRGCAQNVGSIATTHHESGSACHALIIEDGIRPFQPTLISSSLSYPTDLAPWRNNSIHNNHSGNKVVHLDNSSSPSPSPLAMDPPFAQSASVKSSPATASPTINVNTAVGKNPTIRRSTTTFDLAGLYPDIDPNNVQSIFLYNSPDATFMNHQSSAATAPRLVPPLSNSTSPFVSPSISAELGKIRITGSPTVYTSSDMDYFSDESFEGSRSSKRVCLNDRSGPKRGATEFELGLTF